MKNTLRILLFVIVSATFSSCEKDEGKLPAIAFKTGPDYISASGNVPQGSFYKIGITASKTEEEDVLKKFNISKSVNGAASTSVFNKDLSGAEGNTYSYDYSATADTVAGQTNLYIFTITNRDGLTKQISLTLTVN